MTSSSASKVVSTITRSRLWLGAEQPGRGDAVNVRHADVHEDDVGVVEVDRGQDAAAVFCIADHLNPVPCSAKHHLQAPAHQRVVVDQENADRAGHDQPGDRGAQHEITGRVGLVPLFTAGQRDPLGEAGEPCTCLGDGQGSRGRTTGRAADDLGDEPGLAVAGDPHVHSGPRGVLSRVGQTLLDYPEYGAAGGSVGSDSASGTSMRRRQRHPGLPRFLQQAGNAATVGWGGPCAIAGVLGGAR